MKEVNQENIQARIDHLEHQQQIGGRLSVGNEFELSCLHKMQFFSSTPYAWVIKNDSDRSGANPLFILSDTDPSKVWGVKYLPLWILSKDDDRNEDDEQ